MHARSFCLCRCRWGTARPERAACQCTAHHRRCTRCHSRRNTDAGRCRAFFRTRPRGAERTDAVHRLLIPRGAGDPQRGTCRICKKRQAVRLQAAGFLPEILHESRTELAVARRLLMPVHALHRNTWQARLYHTYPMRGERRSACCAPHYRLRCSAAATQHRGK